MSKLNAIRKEEELPWYFKEEIVSNYESWYEGKYKRADQLEKEVLRSAIEWIGGVKTILEVGCGTAHFTRWFEQIGIIAYGLDISQYMLREARKYWRDGNLIMGVSSSIPLRDKSVDVVSFITCFEYMDQPIEIIIEAARVARKGLIFGLMNAWSIPTLRRKVQVLLGLNPFYKNAHFYSSSEMKRLLNKALGKDNYSLFSRSTVFPGFIPIRDSSVPFGAFLCMGIRIGGG